MGLSEDLINQFVKITNDDTGEKKDNVVYGTVVSYSGKPHVRLDGSDQLTPVSTTSDLKIGDRVKVTIGNHTATVTGNVSSPSARKDTVDEAVSDIGNQITEFEIIVAGKVSTEELEAANGRIDNLVSDNVFIKNTLTVHNAVIDNLEAENATITGKLTAQDAEIQNLKTTKLDAEIADIKFATIENLEATNADIHNLEADYGDFKELTTDKLAANDAQIKELEVGKLDAESANLMYANIDFANIGEAAIKKLFSDSGIIKDLIVEEGKITGELVGVTIKGDLIEGGTVIADKLVVKGEDGLYYKLNTDGVTTEAEQTDYNSLNGSVITAKSITATKISVSDLVAFDATIGGFNITESAIYSGVKSSAGNTTRGIYLDRDGQLSVGDSNSYIKYYKDENDVYRLEIAAESLKFTASGKDLESVVGDAIVKSEEEFYLSTSPITLTGGTWSATPPEWTKGHYIWRRTAVTYGDGTSEYTPNQNGVCITGNTGADGAMAAGIDGRNLVLNSNVEITNGEYIVASYNISPSEGELLSTGYGHLVAGENYSVSICVTPPASVTNVAIYTSKGSYEQIRIPTDGTSNKQVLTGIFATTYANGKNPSDDPLNAVIRVYRFPNPSLGDYGNLTIHWIKIERGDKSTGWTLAPEDLASSDEVKHAQETADIANSIATDTSAQYQETKSDFEILRDSISAMVTDETGTSLMTQTPNGWTFNIGAIQAAVEEAANNIDNIQGSVTDVKNIADKANQLANDLAQKTAYINMSQDETGAPCIELGKIGDDFRVRITNTSIDFLQGTSKIAYISNKTLYIQRAIIKDELQIGDVTGFIWKRRENGNLGLRWIG